MMGSGISGFCGCASDVEAEWAAWSPANIWIKTIAHLFALYIGVLQTSPFEKAFIFPLMYISEEEEEYT